MVYGFVFLYITMLCLMQDELLDLRSAPLSLKKPECLSEEFFVR